jgi:hypothetical protein
MGSYTELSVDGYPLVETKGHAVPEVLAVFRESDKRVFERMFSERNRLVWGDTKAEDDELETVILYQASAQVIAQRLDIMGFTLQRAEQDFERLRLEHLEEIQPDEDDTEDVWAESRTEIERLTFAVFAKTLWSVMRRKLRKAPFEDKDRADVSGAERYILNYNEDYLLGYFCSDIRFLLRLACSLVSPDAVIEQDLTEVVNAGYYQEEEAISENVIRTLTEDYPANAKIVIVTEGSSDAMILRESLRVLYPHLVDFYSFFDFDASRAAGGANQVVGVIKAFIAAGISNKVIALLDNDTAAHEAARPLERIALPKNVAVLHYPVLESLRSYPTIGPTGTTPFDVNGLAGSIELYLGSDITGPEHPVQWRGFSEAMQVYQGEVMHKGALQEKFRKKSKSYQSNPELMQDADWSGLDLICRSIFAAFG